MKGGAGWDGEGVNEFADAVRTRWPVNLAIPDPVGDVVDLMEGGFNG